jgi:hypothetical protein
VRSRRETTCRGKEWLKRKEVKCEAEEKVGGRNEEEGRTNEREAEKEE